MFRLNVKPSPGGRGRPNRGIRNCGGNMDQLTEPDWTIDLEDGPAGLQANFGSNCGLRKF